MKNPVQMTREQFKKEAEKFCKKSEKELVIQIKNDFGKEIMRRTEEITGKTKTKPPNNDDVRNAIKAVEKKMPRGPTLRDLTRHWAMMQRLIFSELAQKHIDKCCDEVAKSGKGKDLKQKHKLINTYCKTRH